VRQTSSGQFVQFIHPTVREFLLDRNPPHPAEPFDLDEAPGEFEIAYTCCRYLRITFEAPIALTEADSEFSQVEKVLDHLSDCPLLQYAITCFEYHSRLSAPVGDFTRLKSELESFITALGKGRSYSLLILSKWIRSLNWTLPTHIDEASATAFLGYMLGELAGAGRYQFVDILVTLRAHVDSRDASGRTPLLRAALRGYSDVVELLLSRGADVNAQGGEYGNALQAASWAGHLNVVELLLSTGADVNAQGGEYGNALQAALASGNEKIVELLLSKGADVNAPGGRGGTALYAASDGGHEKVVELLLGAGADVNAQGGGYGTALYAASVGGHEKVVELLLGAGADVNAQGGRDGTALQAASVGGHEKVVELLLGKGAVL
jgi:ankyrin repeat protein